MSFKEWSAAQDAPNKDNPGAKSKDAPAADQSTAQSVKAPAKVTPESKS